MFKFVRSHVRALGGLGALTTVSSAAFCSDSTATRVAELERRLVDVERRLICADPPVAAKVPTPVLYGVDGDRNVGKRPMNPPKEYTDDYYWLRDDDRKDPKILAHLDAENKYCDAMTADLGPFSESLYEELLSHVKETDDSVPYPYGEYDYFTKTIEGLSYGIRCRKKKGSDVEEVILDVNELAKTVGQKHCDVTSVEPSPSHSKLAYAIDTQGYETYDIIVKDLVTGEILDKVDAVDGTVEWGGDDQHIYYTKQDSAHRPYQLWRHKVGAPQSTDEMLYQEDDELYWMGFSKTLDGKYGILSMGSKETTEQHYIPMCTAADAAKTPDVRVIQPRTTGVKYSVSHRNGTFYITTNAGGSKNYKLVTAPVASPGMANWSPLMSSSNQELFGHDRKRTVRYCTCFEDFAGREGGLTKLWVMPFDKEGQPATATTIAMPEEAYTVGTSANCNFSTDRVRLSYSSMVTPQSTMEYYPMQGTMKTLKVKEVPNYDQGFYECKRTTITAADGTKVPLSMVYRKDLYPTMDSIKVANGGKGAAMMLYGYGSYGACMEPSFSSMRLPLLDRGMVYAIAHIRGGSEMGRYWYEDEGKYLTKKNTFTDFTDSAKALIGLGLTSPSLLAIEGASAGGLLMGCVLNMHPELFQVATCKVPFVDMAVTMRDASIPLTVVEWEEWGNPNEEKFHDYIMSYSPIDNVSAQDYPAMLVTAGLHDPRVAYWEATKWVAKLRDQKTDNNPLLLKVDMDSGHFSASDRYKFLKEKGFQYAFLLDQLGLKDEESDKPKSKL